jgi:hypothetical protein
LAVITGLETDDHVVAGLSDAFASGTKFVAAAGHRSSTLAPERTTDNLGDELQQVAWELKKFKFQPSAITPVSFFRSSTT